MMIMMLGNKIDKLNKVWEARNDEIIFKFGLIVVFFSFKEREEEEKRSFVCVCVCS
jgi:hypothetical protein